MHNALDGLQHIDVNWLFLRKYFIVFSASLVVLPSNISFGKLNSALSNNSKTCRSHDVIFLCHVFIGGKSHAVFGLVSLTRFEILRQKFAKKVLFNKSYIICLLNKMPLTITCHSKQYNDLIYYVWLRHTWDKARVSYMHEMIVFTEIYRIVHFSSAHSVSSNVTLYKNVVWYVCIIKGVNLALLHLNLSRVPKQLPFSRQIPFSMHWFQY